MAIHQLLRSNVSLGKYSANTRDIIVINLIKMLSAGPEVSLKGSPMVSPTTAAECSSDPFALSSPNPLASMNFLALSHAPPAFAINTANMKPEVSAPTNGLGDDKAKGSDEHSAAVVGDTI